MRFNFVLFYEGVLSCKVWLDWPQWAWNTVRFKFCCTECNSYRFVRKVHQHLYSFSNVILFYMWVSNYKVWLKGVFSDNQFSVFELRMVVHNIADHRLLCCIKLLNANYNRWQMLSFHSRQSGRGGGKGRNGCWIWKHGWARSPPVKKVGPLPPSATYTCVI